MFTTAGSTRFTIPENEFEEELDRALPAGWHSFPVNVVIRTAETRPDNNRPIKIPTTNVNPTKNAAIIFRRRAQLKSSFTCSPISLLLFIGPGAPECASHRRHEKYNTAKCGSSCSHANRVARINTVLKYGLHIAKVSRRAMPLASKFDAPPAFCCSSWTDFYKNL